LKIRGADTILPAGTNPLKNNYLLRALRGILVWSAACGGHSATPTPEPTAPLPTAGIAAQQVSVLPLTLIAWDDSLRWQASLGERRAALAKSDSVVGALLRARAPEVNWIFPDELRRAARRAPGVAPDPDRMGTAILLHGGRPPELVPDPLRSELRTLAALAGAGGGRYALVPAGLILRRPGGATAATSTGAAGPGEPRAGTAELTVVIVDVRTGRIGFRTVARGEGDDPWTALTRAVKSLTPGLP
jgi:hypothetical protein